MLRKRGIIVLLGLAGACSGFVSVLCFAADPPASKVNPKSGLIEIADSVWSSNNYDIRHTIDHGHQAPETFTVSSNSLDDRRPNLTIAASGDTWVTWWRDDSTDKVLARKRTYATSTWGSERLVSNTGESSRSPAITFDGSKAWVFYQFVSGSNASLAVGVINDEPDPIGMRDVVATTSYTGTVDPDIQAESGHLWASWVDSASYVGWSEYDYASQTWDSPSYQSYSGGTVAGARDTIRSTVLGP